MCSNSGTEFSKLVCVHAQTDEIAALLSCLYLKKKKNLLPYLKALIWSILIQKLQTVSRNNILVA
jgi:hypothetical protein